MTQGTLLALSVLGGFIIFVAGIFIGIGIGYGMGYRHAAEEEKEFADPTAFWAKKAEFTEAPGGYQMEALPNGKGHTLDEDLAEWREAVAKAERLRIGARR